MLLVTPALLPEQEQQQEQEQEQDKEHVQEQEPEEDALLWNYFYTNLFAQVHHLQLRTCDLTQRLKPSHEALVRRAVMHMPKCFSCDMAPASARKVPS